MAENSTPAFSVNQWCADIIEGVGGLEDYERYEYADMSSRVKVAEWVLRCLANPRCEGADKVLAAIHERRWKARTSDA